MQLSFNGVLLLLAANRASHFARLDSDRPNALTADSLGAVVLAAAACEGFINELPQHVQAFEQSVYFAGQVHPALRNVAAVLRRLTRRASLANKYCAAAEGFRGVPFADNEAAYREFRLLVELRHQIMHVKPPRMDGSHEADKFVAALTDRRLTLTARGLEGRNEWINDVMTPEVAEWACKAARDIVVAILEMAPIGEVDPLKSARSALLTPGRFGS